VQIDVLNIQGKKVSAIDIRDDVFAVPFNEAVVHQALLRQLANKRQGTVETKTRGRVKRSSRKLYAQKHTGRARRGAADSPVLVGGGITFGPHPRKYTQSLPKKMRQIAIRSMLSDKAQNKAMVVIDKFELDEPKTKEIYGNLVTLGIEDTVLIATLDNDDLLIKSARNIAGVTLTPARQLNVGDLLSSKKLLLTVDAVRLIESIWGNKSEHKTGVGSSN
jgi:large subunit ribosomal protein L4